MIDDSELPPVGVIPTRPGRATWRTWTPNARSVELTLRDGGRSEIISMRPLPRGYFEAEAALGGHSFRYGYILDGEEPRPDPLSRWQPEGVHGLSAAWSPGNPPGPGGWKGIAAQDLVVYELHVGTFTREGTFDAIIPRLQSLRDLGITCIELMPVAEFAGERSWGYDGVFPFAPHHAYGGPDALRRLVEACHARGLAIFLDVVYNHFGPEGNILPRFGPYLSDKTKSDWGPAVNFDAPGCDPVRAMVIDNARMWIRDYGFDGLRLDAADQIYDRSPRPILSEVAEVVHREAERRGFPALVWAENDMNDARRFLGPRTAGGFGLDGQWNDDFHHAAHVVLTGETDGYYADFADAPAAMAKTFAHVFVNDGNFSPFRDRRHGAPADGFDGSRFLAFTQNHDQVGNRLRSDRQAASGNHPATRLAAGLLLLAPRVPLLFMGQEYGETNPFPFFCDYGDPELIKAVREGRKREFAHFGWSEEPPDPVSAETRDTAVLSWTWDDPVRSGLRRLHADLLRMRREWPALRDFSPAPSELHSGGAVLTITRGATTAESLIVAFNLTDGGQPVPAGLADRPERFRSEIPLYGAEAEGDAATLRPREFRVYADGAGA